MTLTTILLPKTKTKTKIGHVVFKIQHVYGGYNLILLNPIYMYLIRFNLVKIYSRTKHITCLYIIQLGVGVQIT